MASAIIRRPTCKNFNISNMILRKLNDGWCLGKLLSLSYAQEKIFNFARILYFSYEWIRLYLSKFIVGLQQNHRPYLSEYMRQLRRIRQSRTHIMTCLVKGYGRSDTWVTCHCIRLCDCSVWCDRYVADRPLGYRLWTVCSSIGTSMTPRGVVREGGGY